MRAGNEKIFALRLAYSHPMSRMVPPIVFKGV
jgi:hypothetical protein